MQSQWKANLRFTFAVVLVWVVGVNAAHAVPTRNEVYRSDRLNITVFKDSLDPEVFWYIPPVKLYEEDGKVVFYKKTKNETTNYFFYILPYMNDDLAQLLAGEIPGIQNRTQLKPVVAQQFGIQIKQFNTVAMGDQITDYQYLNQPHIIKISLPTSEVEEFEFFLNNKPGIQANVLVRYETEKMAKYVVIEVSCRDIYNALNIGGTGKYSFAKADISQSIEEFTTTKYYNVKSKGDLAIPEIVNKSIEECFTPFKRPEPAKRTQLALNSPPEAMEEFERQVELLGSIEFYGMADDPDMPMPFPRRPGRLDDEPRPTGTDKPASKDKVSLDFTFKKEKMNSEKAFFYRHENFVDSTETKAMQAYLSVLSPGGTTQVSVTPIVKKKLVVEATHSQSKAHSTGIMVGPDEQYIINAVFALSAQSYYESYERHWYRWDAKWGNADEELYYRVGDGPWNKVNGRAVIKTDGLYKGELEFFLDRKKIWGKIDSDFRDTKWFGLVPAIFEYSWTFPQFNVVVTGRKLKLNQ